MNLRCVLVMWDFWILRAVYDLAPRCGKDQTALIKDLLP